MNYGSICSGVEAATLAWSSLGWKAVFFAEVEPFPSAVLCHRFKATRPLRPLDPAVADNEKERKTRELWRRQIAALPEDGTIPNFGDFTLGCVVNRFVLYYANVKKGCRENGECIRTT